MKDLTQGSVTRHLLHMSAFLAVSMVVQTLYLLADLYWVGHLGKEAIAAVGVAGNITMIVLALTQMLGVRTTALISQAAGRKDQPHAELAFNQSFVMSIVIALALGVVGFILRPAYCDWLSADSETVTLATAYLLWFLPGLLLQFPLVALGSALRATGVTVTRKSVRGRIRILPSCGCRWLFLQEGNLKHGKTAADVATPVGYGIYEINLARRFNCKRCTAPSNPAK